MIPKISRGSKGILKATYWIYFLIFLGFLYGPMLIVILLSFQGPYGTMSFPIRDFGVVWWKQFISNPIWGDAGIRSLYLALLTAFITVVFSLMLGMGYRRPFRGGGLLFYIFLAGAVTPGILISVGSYFLWDFWGIDPHWYSSALGVQLTWTLPFGFLIMIAVFNRFNRSCEEAARDLGASEGQTFREVILPLITPGLIGAALFGFTLSLDEFARTMFVTEEKTLPLQIITYYSSRDPSFYALGAATTFLSFILIGTAGASIYTWRRLVRR